jgi:hypothetical protein
MPEEEPALGARYAQRMRVTSREPETIYLRIVNVTCLGDRALTR